MPVRRFRSLERIVALQTDKAYREVQDAVLQNAEELRGYFQQVTASWKSENKPRFTIRVKRGQDFVQWQVVATSNGDIWEWINRGTGLHGPKRAAYRIRPKGNYPLRFRSGYSPKTMPIARYDVGSGKATGDYVTTYEVTHPGIKPREFDSEATKNIQPKLTRDVNNAIRRAIRSIR